MGVMNVNLIVSIVVFLFLLFKAILDELRQKIHKKLKKFWKRVIFSLICSAISYYIPYQSIIEKTKDYIQMMLSDETYQEPQESRYEIVQTISCSNETPTQTTTKHQPEPTVTNTMNGTDNNSNMCITLGHVYKNATCTEPMICQRCGLLTGTALGHEYNNATCTEPEMCIRCGITRGSAIGHEYKNATCTEPEMCIRCGITRGSAAVHDFQNATCYAPKTCRVCKITVGEPASHSWKAATCIAAKNCNICGLTEGNALGHNWKPATIDAPETCRRCGETRGEKKKIANSITKYKGNYTVSASSWFDKNITDVSPSKAIDGRVDTSWDACDDWEGAWISLYPNDKEIYTFTGFSIQNGKAYNPARYSRNEYINTVYAKNGRIKKCRVKIDGIVVWEGTLSDSNDKCYYQFGKSVEGRSFLLEVISVYNSPSYRPSKCGVCITELDLF